MSKYLYVVNYLEHKENYSIPIGVFKDYEKSIEYIILNSENKFKKYFINKLCNICSNKNKYSYNYFLCKNCNIIENNEIIKLKKSIKFNGLNDKHGFYYIHKVNFFNL